MIKLQIIEKETFLTLAPRLVAECLIRGSAAKLSERKMNR